jgi:hypothetical protein
MENLTTELYQASPITGGRIEVPGFSLVTREANARHQVRILGAAEVWADFVEGQLKPFYMNEAFNPTDSGAWDYLCRRYPMVFKETMTTSDFNALTVDVLNRELLGDYTERPIPNAGLTKRATLNDFRNKKVFIFDGLETPFTSVAEEQDLPLGDISQRTAITYAPLKYEKGAKVSWEATINDDLGIFRDLSNRLARGARRTISKFITTLYASSTGPNATLFNTANFANIINIANGASKNNPALDINGLNDAMTVMMKQVDTGGDPIEIPGQMFLVVGPSLFVTAQNLLKQLAVFANVNGGTTQTSGSGATQTLYNAQMVQVSNWIVQNLTLVMDPYLPIVVTAAGTKATQWYIFADPASQGRPALELGFLRGFDTPQLYQKMPNTMRVGGGLEPLLGDFRTMTTEYKVLMAFGGVQLDGRSAVASTGQGV